jgi:hypothetical protein
VLKTLFKHKTLSVTTVTERYYSAPFVSETSPQPVFKGQISPTSGEINPHYYQIIIYYYINITPLQKKRKEKNKEGNILVNK